MIQRCLLKILRFNGIFQIIVMNTTIYEFGWES